ncbi:pentapeptide repeat-containing protein [Legionella sp. PC997]|uniref:pentapeptide repeat-containing protein n=1 Tax=Legionella sp. PC997 TaxID=2755562 RepID=UPI0015FCB48B|nr:pentapeptide repeat-containing protein [Legionella sp. PC997]QMT61558.1 hypothetical protein HBNCFIEN_02962 [Legionella sp. PC997]
MNNKHDLNQQEQMAMIRAERAQRFAEQKAKKEASVLLGHLNSLNECFQRNPFPKDSSEDIYASAERANKYLTAVIELQHQINGLINIWSSRESDLKPLGQAMSEQLGTTGKSCDLDASFEHDFVQFFKYVLLLQDHINEVVSHINDRNEERRNQDKNIIVEVKIIQEHLQHILLQLSGKQFNDREKKKSEPVVTAPVQSVEAVEFDEDINQDNPFFALPNEMMIYILSQIPPQDLLNVRQMAKSKTALVDDTLKMITQPLYIIGFLSQADGITGHQFTAFYQKTQAYQKLKRKVLANKALTAEEAICYTLTRDCNVLPANLKEAMQKLPLDEVTKNHLELILTASEEIQAIEALREQYTHWPIEAQRTHMKDGWAHLLSHLKSYHPHQFVNLLAGADFSAGQFSGTDFSYLNLRGIKFIDAQFRNMNFRGAYLAGANLNGVQLHSVDFTDAELRGVQFHRTNFGNMDLSALDLEGIDFEWAHIRGAKLLPTDALNSPQQLYAALTQFAQRIAKHSAGSKRKLQEHMLEEIAQQLETSAEHSLKEKIALLDVAIAEINPGEMIVGVFPFQNACQQLKEKMTFAHPKQASIEHPLKKEAKEILERIFTILNGTKRGAAEALATNQIPEKINMDAYRTQYRLLMGCIKQYPELNTSFKVVQALGVTPEIWHLLFITCPSIMLLPYDLPPILAGYHCETLKIKEGEKYYASQVFNGHQFDIRSLQKIKLTELDQYLYEAEDFAIYEGQGRSKVHVKLGDLFITFCPGGKGSVFSNVEIIDFVNRKLKPAFSLDLERYGNIPFEAFMPLDPFVNYSATAVGNHWTVDDIRNLQEAFTFKKQVIERIFTSEKMHRHHKFYPIFEQYEAQEKSQFARLPRELVDVVCAYVHGNTLKQHQHISPLAEVNELHELFSREHLHSMPVKSLPKRAVPSTPIQEKEKEKGKEKEVIRGENTQPKSTKLAVSKGPGLFTSPAKVIAQEPARPDVPPKRNISEQNKVSVATPKNAAVSSVPTSIHTVPGSQDHRLLTAPKEIPQQRFAPDASLKRNIPEHNSKIPVPVPQNVLKRPVQAGQHAPSKGPGLFAAPKEVPHQRSLPVSPTEQNSVISVAVPKNAAKKPDQAGTLAGTSQESRNLSKQTVQNQPRMFPAVVDRAQRSAQNETQGPSKKTLPKPIAVDVTTSGNCLIS